MNDAPPMSDAPPMTQEDAVEDRYIKDRFMNGGIFKAKKSAIKEQKIESETNAQSGTIPSFRSREGLHRTFRDSRAKSRGESPRRFYD